MRCNETKKDTRKHGKHLRVPALAPEEAVIKEDVAKLSITFDA